jgi:hypothetical protein
MTPVHHTILALVLTVLVTIGCTQYVFAEHGPSVGLDMMYSDVNMRRTGEATASSPDTLLPAEADEAPSSDWVAVSSSSAHVTTPAPAPDQSLPPRGPVPVHTTPPPTNHSSPHLVFRGRAI